MANHTIAGVAQHAWSLFGWAFILSLANGSGESIQTESV